MRIAVIYPSPFLDSTPCLFNLIQGLADLGHELDVFTGRDGRYTDPDFSGSVRVWFHEGSRREFIGWFSRQTRGKIGGYAAIIAMDRLGMFAAAAAIRLSKRPPLVYFNLELYRPPIFRGWKHAIANSAEAFLIRRMARLILAPSKERGEALANWYRLRSGDIFTLPNAPRGMAAAAKGDYLAKKYGILPERPTALYFGSLTSANRIEELIQSARQNWPE
ncbi:glycosyltransferase, partial [Candidatus Sumerlaeota bacterium]|nr:glycosyltransferase [Candidatus Sumerlaeota bacterium]